MTQRIFTELSDEPLRDAYWNTQIYLEIEDDTLEEVSKFMKNYIESKSIDVEEVAEPLALKVFLNELRNHPNVLKAEKCSFFWPFGN